MNKSSIGILAYGSLLSDPGEEINAAMVRRISVETPFPIEYARSSKGRDGAPTLVLVPEGHGAPVQAQILLIQSDMQADKVRDILYRREINRVGDLKVQYDEEAQKRKGDPVLVRIVEGLGSVPKVFYTYLEPNIDLVLDTDRSITEKAKHLANLAIQSVTSKTYTAGRDGIQYLADAIQHGIETSLTGPYRAAVLSCVGDAPDLETARQRVALNNR